MPLRRVGTVLPARRRSATTFVRRTRTVVRALLQLNDDLTAEHALVRGILALAEPEPTGDRLWDAAIAALVAWRLNRSRSRSLLGWTTHVALAWADRDLN